MRVIHHLNTKDVRAIPGEAAWAESMGYDGVTASETGHDPLLAMTLAATATSRVSLETHVAIAFPRSPMVLAYTSRDIQDLSGGRFRLGLGTQVKGHIERRYSTVWESRAQAAGIHPLAEKHLDGVGNGRKARLPGRFLPLYPYDPFLQPWPGKTPPNRRC